MLDSKETGQKERTQLKTKQ